VLAADLPAAEVAVLAATQRPADTATMTDPLRGPAAWRTIPSWTLVTTRDYSLPPDAQRFMASRAGSSTAETASSHAVPLVRPETVADLILGAARAAR
jgi:pimeloyl-ACP methyl ester carboxylesterase